MFACARIAKHESQSTLILIYVSQTITEMEQSGIEVGVRAIRKWWEAACRENHPFVILCENSNEHREEAKRNRGGRSCYEKEKRSQMLAAN